MFFTQEDYRKIEKWLLANSGKDTDFVGAATPLKGNETVVLVQDGKNVKTSVKDIVDQFFLLGVSDFLNITDKYGESYISIDQAIQLIPFRSRKEGQVITFLNTDGNWEIYQFTGKLNQWNNPTLWNNPFDWEKFIIDSILPDEEDLTKSLPDENGNSYLSLKDREYNPESFSGLGRVILRKNIVEVEDPIYGKVTKNILFQDMIAQANTVYEIRYDFDLNGAEITIPLNCTIYFNGGSFGNGRLNCRNAITILAYNHSIFNNVIVNGLHYANIKWFGAKGDGNSDDTNSIQLAINSIEQDPSFIRGGDVFIPSGDYIITNLNVTKKYSITFKCLGSPSNSTTTTSIRVVGSNSVGFDTTDSQDISFRNIRIVGGTSLLDAPKSLIFNSRSVKASEGGFTRGINGFNMQCDGHSTVSHLYLSNCDGSLWINCQFKQYNIGYAVSIVGVMANDDIESPFLGSYRNNESSSLNYFISCGLSAFGLETDHEGIVLLRNQWGDESFTDCYYQNSSYKSIFTIDASVIKRGPTRIVGGRVEMGGCFLKIIGANGMPVSNISIDGLNSSTKNTGTDLINDYVIYSYGVKLDSCNFSNIRFRESNKIFIDRTPINCSFNIKDVQYYGFERTSESFYGFQYNMGILFNNMLKDNTKTSWYKNADLLTIPSGELSFFNIQDSKGTGLLSINPDGSIELNSNIYELGIDLASTDLMKPYNVQVIIENGLGIKTVYDNKTVTGKYSLYKKIDVVGMNKLYIQITNTGSTSLSFAENGAYAFNSISITYI